MTWARIEPLGSNRVCGRSHAVEFSVSPQLGVGTQKGLIVLLTVRANLMRDCPPFLKAGGRFQALLGQGEQAGMLRIEPGADYSIGKSGGAGAHNVLCLRLRRPDCVVNRICRGVAEFDYADGWLEVTIPPWALVQAPAMAVAASLKPIVNGELPTPAPKAPYRSAIADVPHNVRRGA